MSQPQKINERIKRINEVIIEQGRKEKERKTRTAKKRREQ